MISHFVDGSVSRQLLVGLGGADVWGVCGGGVAADGVGWRVMEEPLSESEWGERPLWLAGPSVSALMHLAISMFLLVATGSAAPPPRLTCQNAYQSQHAVARGLSAAEREREGVWVRAVSASASVFCPRLSFISLEWGCFYGARRFQQVVTSSRVSLESGPGFTSRDHKEDGSGSKWAGPVNSTSTSVFYWLGLSSLPSPSHCDFCNCVHFRCF